MNLMHLFDYIWFSIWKFNRIKYKLILFKKNWGTKTKTIQIKYKTFDVFQSIESRSIWEAIKYSVAEYIQNAE